MQENLAILWRQLIESRIERVHTWLPAKIISFDAQKLRASVRPTLKKVIGPGGNETKLPFPLIFEVPVDVIKTENFIIRPPYAKDDPVTIGFYERSVEEILRDIEQRDPKFSRKHHLTDALVVQGRMTDTEWKTRPAPRCWLNELIIHRRMTGTVIRITSDGDIVIQCDPKQGVFLGPGPMEDIEPLMVAPHKAVRGTPHKGWADAHVHSCGSCGVGTTGPPVVPSPVLSEHVFIGD